MEIIIKRLVKSQLIISRGDGNEIVMPLVPICDHGLVFHERGSRLSRVKAVKLLRNVWPALK